MGDFIINGKTVASLQIGGKEVIRIADGQTILWEKTTPTPPSPSDPDMLHFTAEQANSTIRLDIPSEMNLTFYKSTDGINFDSWDGSTVTLSNIGDKLYVYGNNQTISTSSSSHTKFLMTGLIAAAGDVTYLFNNGGLSAIPNNYGMYGLFIGCTSLTAAPELPATTLREDCYNSMFASCRSLTNPPVLPATILANNCYRSMFNYCTALTNAPTLSATTLASGCYNSMFEGCSSLTIATALPATTLANYCYQYMFYHCTALSNAPSLPATTLAFGCYQYMFAGCTSLITAPTLSATTLSDVCYNSMFEGCTTLTTAPLLPATTLSFGCYQNMFKDCSNLNSVTCLAIDISATACTANWLYGVAQSGTFTKDQSMSNWTTGESGIPTGWTVETPPQVATPTITVETTYTYCEYDQGEYANGNEDVTILTSTADATIYYRQYSESEVYDQENDSWSTEWDEDTSGWTLYDGVVSTGGYYLDNIGTDGQYKIEAKAIKTGYTDSEIATEIYTSSTDEYSTSCVPPEPDYCQECIDGCGGDPDCEAVCNECDQPCGEPCTDCSDCNNWSECGWNSYEDCLCSDCNSWSECGYESFEDCECQMNGNCGEEEPSEEEEPTE